MIVHILFFVYGVQIIKCIWHELNVLQLRNFFKTTIYLRRNYISIMFIFDILFCKLQVTDKH